MQRARGGRIIALTKMGKRSSGVLDPGVELRRVQRWRRDQFYELGFPLADARKLADAPVDMGVARRLIASGCPPATAVRILI